MKGYKVFNPDWTCQGFQYAVGETYEMNGLPELCIRGFHFCDKLADCFNYYGFDPRNKVAEVEALGDIDSGEKEYPDKRCTNKIRIVRELTWYEVLDLCNTGNRNTGDRNTGDRNTGDRNTGNWNTGNRNTGYCNTGYWNTGDRNTGDRNTGNWNTGNRNTGYWNTCNYSSGCFCTTEHKIMLFDKPSDLTLNDWFKSRAKGILSHAPNPIVWVPLINMSDAEKAANPSAETTKGYLKTLTKEELVKERQSFWDKLSAEDKAEILSIPNFDPEIFKECTLIDVTKGEQDERH